MQRTPKQAGVDALADAGFTPKQIASFHLMLGVYERAALAQHLANKKERAAPDK